MGSSDREGPTVLPVRAVTHINPTYRGERCADCGGYYAYPVDKHHSPWECTFNLRLRRRKAGKQP